MDAVTETPTQKCIFVYFSDFFFFFVFWPVHLLQWCLVSLLFSRQRWMTQWSCLMEPMRMLDCLAPWLGHIQVSVLLTDYFTYCDLAWHYIFSFFLCSWAHLWKRKIMKIIYKKAALGCYRTQHQWSLSQFIWQWCIWWKSIMGYLYKKSSVESVSPGPYNIL